MTPLEFFVLVTVTVLALVGMAQIPLVQDAIAATGESTGVVMSGIATIVIFFYVILAIFRMRT